MLGIPLGLLTVNGIEWYAHKHLLHGKGRDRNSRWASHWDHHRVVRQSGFTDQMYDPALTRTFDHERARMEAGSLVKAALVLSPLVVVAPLYTATLYYGAVNYWYTHRRAHLDPDWARRKVPWHYDHHMNANQNANWCVTKPWFDYIMGTRVISSPDLQESNPTGVRLPGWLEKPLNRMARRLAPRAFEKLDQLARQERQDRMAGKQGFVPEFARDESTIEAQRSA